MVLLEPVCSVLRAEAGMLEKGRDLRDWGVRYQTILVSPIGQGHNLLCTGHGPSLKEPQGPGLSREPFGYHVNDAVGDESVWILEDDLFSKPSLRLLTGLFMGRTHVLSFVTLIGWAGLTVLGNWLTGAMSRAGQTAHHGRALWCLGSSCFPLSGANLVSTPVDSGFRVIARRSLSSPLCPVLWAGTALMLGTPVMPFSRPLSLLFG